MSDDERIFTEAEMEAAIQVARDRRQVFDVVCPTTGRRWPKTAWAYATGEVSINSVSIRERSQWENDYITRSVMRVQARPDKDGSSSEMTCYNLLKALLPTGLTNAMLGSLDLGNQRRVLLMLKELIEANLIEDRDERNEAVGRTQASLLARFMQWGEQFQAPEVNN